jgi:histidyl-tRNA synthetase
VTLNLNTLGDVPSRDAWRAALIAHFEAHKDQLSEESLDRLQRNPLRILDSKDPRDRPVADSAPDIDAYLTDEARSFFEKVTSGLDAAGVAWERNARLGAQGTVLGGGRYDGLIENLGGPSTPAVGWAAGIERLAMLVDMPEPERPMLALVVENDDCVGDAIKFAAQLRRRNLSVEMISSGSIKKRFDKAKKLGTRYAFVLNMVEDDGYPRPSFSIKNFNGDDDSYRKMSNIVQEITTGYFPPRSMSDIQSGQQIPLFFRDDF